MVAEIFVVIGDIVTGVTGAFLQVFTGIAQVFYTPGIDTAPGSLTIVGILALLGVGFGLARWGFSLIMRLIKMKG